jgi:hypothetical protein
MTERHDEFDGHEARHEFEECCAKTAADESALERLAEDDFQEFWEIVECMAAEGWDSAIAAWEAADKRRCDTNAERILSAAAPPAPSSEVSEIKLKKDEKNSHDGRPAIPVLLELLQDQDERVRFLAASVLGGVGPEASSAVPALTGLLEDESRAVRRIAAKALRKIESEKK